MYQISAVTGPCYFTWFSITLLARRSLLYELWRTGGKPSTWFPPGTRRADASFVYHPSEFFLQVGVFKLNFQDFLKFFNNFLKILIFSKNNRPKISTFRKTTRPFKINFWSSKQADTHRK